MPNLIAAAFAFLLPLNQITPVLLVHRSPVPIRHLTHANGVVTSYAYDAASQLTNLTHALGATTLATADYTYDPVGNRLTLADLTGTHTFTYDLLNRLTQATHPLDPLEHFSYDAVGNRDPATSTVDPANRLTDDGTFTYTYDANGNVTSKTNKATLETTTYTYDAEQRLIAVNLPTGETLRDAYDGLGRKIQEDRNGLVTRFVSDDEDVLLEYDGTNTLRARYTHGPGIDEPWLRARDADGNGTLEESLTYLADGLGSIIALTDSTGTVLERVRYASFGPPTITDPLGAPRPTSAVNNRLLFTARPYEPLTGLYDLRARVLDSVTGRFLQEDPAGVGITRTNGYPYAENDPINETDSLGLIVDTLFDVGFVLADLKKLIQDGNCDLGLNLAVLGADIGALIIPGITGAGVAVRGTAKIAGKVGNRVILEHAAQQAVERGVPARRILEALRHPVRTRVRVDKLGRKSIQHIAADGTIVVTDASKTKVITVIGRRHPEF